MVREKHLRTGAVLVLFIFAVVSASTQSLAVSRSIGQNYAELVLLDLDGNAVRLGDMAADKPVLLYFWATWCKPCRTTRPMVSAFSKKYKDQIQVLGINVGGMDSAKDIKRYRKSYDISYPLLIDRHNGALTSYSVIAIPAFILLDSSGKISYRGNLPPERPNELFTK